MDVGVPEENRGNLVCTYILRESLSIPKRSPKTFLLITLAFVSPLSIAILAHSFFANPILNPLETNPSPEEWTLLLTFQFWYLIFLFAFSLLSTAAVVFTVASDLYTSKPVSFSSTVSAIPKVFNRLIITFTWVFLFMFVYNALLAAFAVLYAGIDTQNDIFSYLSFMVIFFLFVNLHVYTLTLWQLGSVVSVLEPIYGLAAMKKSYGLLKGKALMGFFFVVEYLLICSMIEFMFVRVVVHGGERYGGIIGRIVIAGILVGVSVIVNVFGLLLQTVFYFVCKSHHRQKIDEMTLADQLGGYLGEYAPLRSSIKMENLGARLD